MPIFVRESQPGFRPVVPVLLVAAAFLASVWFAPSTSLAQSVGLPTPRLLTTIPMGGPQGSHVDITISGENLDGADELLFSDRRISATRKLDSLGKPVPNQYTVNIAADCPVGLYEAHLMTRLGISSSRVFSVGTLPEVTQTQPNTSLATAKELQVNSVCNAVVTVRAADHYVFEARKGQRIAVDCASRGIDSKLEAVLVIADATGRDLLVERRMGAIDFAVPEDGRYVIKVHELTYQGGPAYYYRLTLRELPPDVPLVRHPSTNGVSSYSWPPVGLAAKPATFEREPNNDRAAAQKISLPCELAGSFFPADDSDIFEFEAKKGEEWWVEIASERLGLPTDPSAFVEVVTGSGAEEKVTEVVEFTDIPSPVKVSSNGYAYDGPPYNAGSPDFLGKLVIPQDGVYRLHLTDLFGGTRNDPRNVYRLVIRKAQPDFAVVAWPLHMELRNGDRAALSKPLALRRGATVAMEVVAFRRDGFDGDIDLVMEGLPEGVSAQGLKIPAGKNRGLLLVSASATAVRSVAFASITAKGKVQGEPVSHPCRVATVAWPIPDSWGEIPAPRLSADVPVSVGGIDTAPITIAPSAGRVIEAKVGEKLTIAYTQTRRSEFSGASAPLRPVGAGFESAPTLEVPLTADGSQVVIDLAALKLPPGDHQLAFVGYAVAKYRHEPEQIDLAKLAQQQAEKDVANLAEEAKRLAGDAAALEALAVKQKAAAAALAATNEQFKRATETAQPRDIVDILVTEPISVRIQPTESK